MRLPTSLLLLVSALVLDRASFIEAMKKERKLELREETRSLFNHGFDAYMHNAFPMDELQPLSCRGRGPDGSNDGSINDVCGDFSMTLIDVIDTFVVLGNRTAFEEGVRTIIQTVSFNKDVKVQVFEVTIRVLGGLLSAHQFASSSPSNPRPDFALSWYNGELLHLAEDLGKRLLPAFRTLTGIPYARVNLRKGVSHHETAETCTAGAGSLILEFAVLSRLTGDPRFEQVASRAFFALWNRRSASGLLGNAISAGTGAWISPLVSHVGAGSDSFHEIALKAYILLGEEEYHDVFQEAYGSVMNHVRGEEGFWFRGARMDGGERIGLTVDSLSAFFPGLQVLSGDVANGIKSHLVYWNLWKRYGGIPESFHIIDKKADSLNYPIRPEFVESNYFLFRATKDELYLQIGERILHDLSHRAKTPCGIASFKNLITGELEDRMESFALSETLKYLYLLFDDDNWVNKDHSNMVFTTEAHLLHLNASYLHPASPTRRKLRSSERLACIPYAPHHLSLHPPHYSSPSSFGLLGGIRGRPDFDFARHLTGFPLDRVEEKEALSEWDGAQYCDGLIKEEPYMLDVVFTMTDSGQKIEEEDPSPGPEKLLRIDRGYVLKSVAGIRAQVAKRMDGRGYDVTKLGPHRVRSGQKIFLTDPDLNKMYDEQLSKHSTATSPNSDGPNSDSNHDASSSSSSPLPPTASPLTAVSTSPPRDPIVILRFSVQSSSSGTTEVFAHSRAGTASFGGIVSPSPHAHPSPSSAPPPPSPPPALLSTTTPSLPLVLPPSHPLNNQGCSPLSNPHSSPSILLLKRGGCTFQRKLAQARLAGYAGVIVWEPDGRRELVNPADEEGREQDGSVEGGGGGEVLLFLPGGVGAMGAKLERKVMGLGKVKGSGTLMVSALEVGEEEGGGGGEVRGPKYSWEEDGNVDLKRILWINSLPVLNALVVGSVSEVL